MNFEILQEFVTAARTGSFHTTAKLLFTNTSSVSRHIRSLEKELGVSLFYRDSQGVALTSKGILMLEKAEQILHVRDDISRQLNVDRNPSDSELIIGIHSADAYLDISKHTAYFNETFPDVRVEVRTFTDHLFKGNLLNRNIDIAIELYNTYNVADGIGSLVIDNVEMLVGVADQSDYIPGRTSVKDLAKMTLIAPRFDLFPGFSYYMRIVQKSLGITFKNIEEVDSILDMMSAVGTPNMWVMIPRHYLNLTPQNVQTFTEPRLPAAPLVALWAQSNRNPNIIHFLLQIKDMVR